jgi:riboflavin synthase
MFSGIVETIGFIKQLVNLQDCLQLTISPQLSFTDLHIGDSVSVNGVCLTVTRFDATSFDVTIVPETLRLTNLGNLEINSLVNLERALPANGRFGGHYVQGHVDGIAEIIDLTIDGKQALLVTIKTTPALSKYIVNKGYITLDGMSITVIKAKADAFTVTFIPHTQAATIVQHYQIGTQINLEVDILAKYVEKLLASSSDSHAV